MLAAIGSTRVTNLDVTQVETIDNSDWDSLYIYNELFSWDHVKLNLDCEWNRGKF